MQVRHFFLWGLAVYIGWKIGEHVYLASSVGIALDGTPEGKAYSNHFMANTLWTFFGIGLVINAIRSMQVFNVWKSLVIRGLIISLASGFCLLYFAWWHKYGVVATLILFSFCFGAGYAIGMPIGKILRHFVPEKFRPTNGS